MKRFFLLANCILFISYITFSQSKTLSVSGLQQPVEVIRDTYGINHIYAQNENDLFFTQGYCAAKDRLFQFEIWRRQATGTVAEILGPRELTRDIGTRLFQFRGDIKQELNHYHERGELIIQSYVDGVNAYIEETRQNPKLLTIEFKLLNITPGKWTAADVISRHQGLVGNLTSEIKISRAVATLGADRVNDLIDFEPGTPDLTIDPVINQQLLFDNVIELYEAFRKPIVFSPKDLVTSANPDLKEYQHFTLLDEAALKDFSDREKFVIGSNNWIVDGSHSQSKFPLLANDPHRSIMAPSLRYMVHLNAPGWNVLGGGEPEIPGISIGHNEHGAWGLTIFGIDAEDLYVYELNPKNQNQYRYLDGWEDMRIIKDTVHVKGAPDVFVEHKYTRHGPVTYSDVKNNKAYAVRCGWLEPGGAPYLASLRMNQATTWEEFREACSHSHIPAENMIWADRKGNIGWQAVGIAPIRKNWSGLVAVPGDGRYEWSGYLPIKSLPNIYNPGKGYWATANENLIPQNYADRNAVGWEWSDSFRADRINEILGSGRKHSLADMMGSQFDYLSIPARTLVPLLSELKSADPKVEIARSMLLNWNYILEKTSNEAAIYTAWEKRLYENMLALLVPENSRDYIRYLELTKTISWITSPRPEFGSDPVKGRDQFLLSSLKQAVDQLSAKLGPDMKKWKYGQEKYHHILVKHPLSNAVDEVTRKKLEVGPMPRGGNGSTLGMTTNSENQSAGASFRMVVDTKDWDKTMFTNAPGQSGDPDSPYYKNLFELWANDKHFPVYFSRARIEKVMAEKLLLQPN
ncbi:MAG: penicillin acylase family protein [Bacteroidia bacterium]|nr:penicillin acylase family protein [Bacteroidia bacterium]